MKKIFTLLFIAAIIACSSYRSQPFPYFMGLVNMKYNEGSTKITSQVPRLIRADSREEAVAIFNKYITELAKKYNAVLLMDSDNYAVWKVEPDIILTKNTNNIIIHSGNGMR